MNIWAAPLALVLSCILPLVPSAAEAPAHTSTFAVAGASFSQLGEGSFAFRWSSQEVSDNSECQLYAWCAFADIVGPTCPNEVFVALEFYDKNDELVTEGGDILSGLRRQRFIGVEIGTNRDITFEKFKIVDIECGPGLPTGHGKA
jgi:hypothetical protein